MNSASAPLANSAAAATAPGGARLGRRYEATRRWGARFEGPTTPQRMGTHAQRDHSDNSNHSNISDTMAPCNLHSMALCIVH